MIDINGSLDTLARGEHCRDHGPLKLTEDIDRYEKIIGYCRPDVIIETGTHTGDSARWLQAAGNCRVITIDVLACELRNAGQIKTVTGSSTDPRVIHRVVNLVSQFDRIMVSLDSDHSTAHVAAEIMLYGPLVTPGCYLVIEDGIFHYADADLRAQHGLADMKGDPLDAVLSSSLPHSSRWRRDRGIEDMHAVTHNPAGWWERV